MIPRGPFPPPPIWDPVTDRSFPSSRNAYSEIPSHQPAGQDKEAAVNPREGWRPPPPLCQPQAPVPIPAPPRGTGKWPKPNISQRGEADLGWHMSNIFCLTEIFLNFSRCIRWLIFSSLQGFHGISCSCIQSLVYERPEFLIFKEKTKNTRTQGEKCFLNC